MFLSLHPYTLDHPFLVHELERTGIEYREHSFLANRRRAVKRGRRRQQAVDHPRLEESTTTWFSNIKMFDL